jgi:glycine oxidase
MTGGVVIVGGGVVGLSAAYALAREGVLATVLDRGPLGREASWAGAGILSPAATIATGDPDVALRSLSARLHAEWAGTLRDETGLDNGYRPCGGLDVALDGRDEAELAACVPAWRAEGLAFERLRPGELAAIEPALGPAIRAAYLLPGRAQIRNPWHLRALIAACERRGVRLRPGVGAGGFEVAGERVVAVRTSEGREACDRVVVASGPWTEGLLGPLGVRVETPPVRGQIVLLNPGRRVLGRVVERGAHYLVPRDEGRVLVGATEELAGFDPRTTSGGVRDLIDLALRLCPALADAEVERAWAGLRPGSRDGRPYLGPAPGLANLFVAAGHKRAGLMLSTGTAAVVADWVLGRPSRIPLESFRPDREPRPGVGVFRS